MKLQFIEKMIDQMQGSSLQYLDLECAGSRLQLRRIADAPADRAPMPADGGNPAPSHDAAIDLAPGIVIAAPACGKLLYSHPLATAGAFGSAKKGEAVAYLQVGPLVSAIAAPFDGFVHERVADDGAIVGYGTVILRFVEASVP